ncbi:unnamed protein product [Parascedosporium putredinis]|uniref:Stress response protein NST1 n=1 Tax=Parascedosporium putredinis TaxID=1442378 RepID=A0A9P1GXS3_9PEZI|nr:unnamed protein product [Parascedosporium putredinis]CAI7989479.1 unnamed protein product [Parascedosporium putredinis]
MKEQQKNTCSCAVCGRKRSAIEQELEGLYDSYYRELENYANRADGSLLGAPMGSDALRGVDDEEDSYPEEELEDDDDPYSEEDISDDDRRENDQAISDFLDFGNSLQVKGGILTVADDLLKNDGRKFIEMMEQLAERRMAREEEGDYDDDEDEVEEAMTDQQRMEEGRRMFQIFAARMFEQRLLQELDDEKRQEEERKAQKASKAAKKRDPEKAAEEAAKKREAERRVEEQRKLLEDKRKAKEAQKRKEEEERDRKEAERLKRQQEQERKIKEARDAKEREKRTKEEQRQREKEARETKERQEREQKERQVRERQQQKERDARERKERQETQDRERRTRDPQLKGDREGKEKQKGQSKSTASKGGSVQAAIPKAAAGKKQPTGQAAVQQQAKPEKPVASQSVPLQHTPSPAAFASPKVAVATPILHTKTTHPIRSRTSSQQHDVSLPPAVPLPQGALARFGQSAGDPMLGLNHAFGLPSEMAVGQQSRQLSGSLDPSPPPLAGQPISRPAPIGRPASVVHGQRPLDRPAREAFDEEQEHLGSRALLDDDPEEHISLGQGSIRQRVSVPGPNIRTQFPSGGFMDAPGFGSPFHPQWGGAAAAFSPQSGLGSSLWSAPGAQFGAPGVPPVAQLRSRPQVNAVALRHMLCLACQALADTGQATTSGYVDFSAVKSTIFQGLGHDVADGELLAISETEGNGQNGGGTFDSTMDSGRRLIRAVTSTSDQTSACCAHGENKNTAMRQVQDLIGIPDMESTLDQNKKLSVTSTAEPVWNTTEGLTALGTEDAPTDLAADPHLELEDDLRPVRGGWVEG